MEEKRIEVTENEELLKEEVDIYELPDCDIVRKKCCLLYTSPSPRDTR